MSDIIGCHSLNIPDGLFTPDIDAIAYLDYQSVFISDIFHLIIIVIIIGFIMFIIVLDLILQL